MKSLIHKIRLNFFTGLFTFLPLGLTVYLVYLISIKTNTFILSVTPKHFYEYITHDQFGLLFRLLILVTIVLFIASVGALMKFYIGRKLLHLAEDVLENIPVLNKIYSGIKQVNSAIFSSQNKFFQKVVVIEYPRKDIYSIGFMTGHAQGELKSTNDLINVFVPTTPNPTSGLFVMVPQKDVRFLEISVEDAMKLIISSGAVYPETLEQQG